MTGTKTSKKILVIDVYSTTWGWDTENVYYDGTDMYAWAMRVLMAGRQSGHMTAGLTDGSKRYTLSTI
jgi:hypothetical protein